MQDLNGRTAIVTGAGSGIGSGIAKALARAGMNLVLADVAGERQAARARHARIEAAFGRAAAWGKP
jgi:NAD(P)-dependent dehydrogenase (short-subunit alcohol dehydrogenase family)